MRKILSFLILIAAFSGEAVGAATALAYGQRIARAAEQIDRIKADEQYSREGISHIKELLPKSEEVETGGVTIKVDNSWLHMLLDEYRAQEDAQKRAAALDEASGRLRALGQHLDEIEAGTDSEMARERIGEILRRSEYREKAEDRLTAFIKRVRNQIFSFLQELITRIFAAITGAGTGASWLFRGILILGLLAGVAAAIRMLMRVERKKKRGAKRTVLGEEIEEGMTSKGLADAALASARAGDYRMAVRKLYISLIYEMAEKNILELDPGATNREYLRRVSSYSALSPLMRYLTDRFEYFWYGLFSPTEEDFSVYYKTYQSGLENIRLVSESVRQSA